GAFQRPGNTTSSAEFNIHFDPDAARSVCRSGVPLTWVPLDVTLRCLLAAEDLPEATAGPRARFARDVCRHFIEAYRGTFASPKAPLHDPLAVSALVWPELLRGRGGEVGVETGAGPTRGRTTLSGGADRSPSVSPHFVCLE